MKNIDIYRQFTFSASPTKDEIRLIPERLDDYYRTQTDGEYDQPGIEINLIIKDGSGNVAGGVIASTKYRVMHLEVLWVADEYRKFGFGRDLVLAAERIGFEKGCITSQTMTFSFQAPGFYQKIGYELLGIYDGYPLGITEYVLKKKLQPHQQDALELNSLHKKDAAGQFSITEDATPAELKILHTGLNKHADEYVGNGRKGVPINLIIKNAAGQVVGGLIAFTTLKNMIFESLWIDERYRGFGLGAKLMLDAEGIAKENECIASFVYSLSFQAPQIFHKLGYQTFGVSDGYPKLAKEYYLIKKFE